MFKRHMIAVLLGAFLSAVFALPASAVQQAPPPDEAPVGISLGNNPVMKLPQDPLVVLSPKANMALTGPDNTRVAAKLACPAWAPPSARCYSLTGVSTPGPFQVKAGAWNNVGIYAEGAVFSLEAATVSPTLGPFKPKVSLKGGRARARLTFPAYQPWDAEVSFTAGRKKVTKKITQHPGSFTDPSVLNLSVRAPSGANRVRVTFKLNALSVDSRSDDPFGVDRSYSISQSAHRSG